jgi:folate-binding Fe-S cluster repair protein YgfZ
MTSPLLSRPGAVVIDGGVVAAHYGDPLREQRLLAEGAGLVDRSDRDVVTVPGPDRLSWLHSITSQHLDRLADGSGSEALVL